MSDPLVSPGGVLTLGISDAGARASKGVYWSLSLAHHKFYGKPVLKTAQVDESGSRMSLLQLQQATIGAILARWRVPPGDSTVEALRFLLQLGTFMLHDRDPADLNALWIEMLTVPIAEYFRDEEAGSSAVMLGRRRDQFIPRRQEGIDRPFFGLIDVGTLLGMILGIEDRINFLHRMASKVKGLESRQWLVAYLDRETWCYVSISPKPESDQVTARQKRARRCHWVPRGFSPSAAIRSEPITKFKKSAMKHSRTMITNIAEEKTFTFFFGNADVAAVFTLSDSTSAQLATPEVHYEDLLWAFQHDMIKTHALRVFLFQLLKGKAACPIMSLLVQLSAALHMYSSLDAEGATISCRVLSSPFVIDRLSLEFNELEIRGKVNGTALSSLYKTVRSEIFAVAIIAYFETGHDFILSSSRGSLGTIAWAVCWKFYLCAHKGMQLDSLPHPSVATCFRC